MEIEIVERLVAVEETAQNYAAVQFNFSDEWTDERIAILKQMIAEKHPRKDIAAALGLSKSAVCGKTRRLGLSVPRGPKKPRSERRGALGQDGAQGSRIANRSRKRRPGLAYGAEPAWLVGQQFDCEIPIEQRRSLLELTQHTCRWPIGDPGTPTFFFCGGPADNSHSGPYCHAHTWRALPPAA